MTVRTRLHKLFENVAFPQDVEYQAITDSFLSLVKDKPLFVVSEQAGKLMLHSGVGEIIDAMHEAGRFRLPHEEVVVELPAQVKLPAQAEGIDASVIAHIKETGTTSFVGHCALVFNDRYFVYPAVNILTWEGDGATFHVDGKFAESVSESFLDKVRPVVKQMGAYMSQALTCAVMMLDVKGFDCEVISYDKLNKSREKKGKPGVPSHTYVNLTKVYRSDGSAIDVKDGGGAKMPMHIRSGYMRRQRYGHGNELTKMIYIEPCVVNFAPDEKMVVKPKKVTA